MKWSYLQAFYRPNDLLLIVKLTCSPCGTQVRNPYRGFIRWFSSVWLKRFRLEITGWKIWNVSLCGWKVWNTQVDACLWSGRHFGQTSRLLRLGGTACRRRWQLHATPRLSSFRMTHLGIWSRSRLWTRDPFSLETSAKYQGRDPSTSCWWDRTGRWIREGPRS